MKKVVLLFIICFSGLKGYSQMTDNTAGLVIPLMMTLPNDYYKSATSINNKIEMLNKKIATAKKTKVTKKARAEAIKLMTEPGVIANSKLLSAVQEIYDSAVNKYNELIQGVDKTKAKAEAIAKNN